VGRVMRRPQRLSVAQGEGNAVGSPRTAHLSSILAVEERLDQLVGFLIGMDFKAHRLILLERVARNWRFDPGLKVA